LVEVMVDDGYECGIVVEVVVADAEGFGCAVKVEGWR
jgi:hypothetical protein